MLIYPYVEIQLGSSITPLILAPNYINYAGYIIRSDINKIPLDEWDKAKANTIESKDSVYFLKGSGIPRYKIKEYCISNKIEINKTNRINYANTYTVNFQLIHDFYKTTWNKAHIIPLKYIKENPLFFNKLIIDECVLKKADYVLIKNLASTPKNFHKFDLVEYYAIKDKKQSTLQEIDLFKSFEICFDKFYTHKIVYDETLIDMCNSESIIDNEMYESIRNMLLSGDKSNHKLAVEIISNSNFKESRLYILFLLNEFYNSIASGGLINVNFAALISYFRKDQGIWGGGSGWETLTNNMYLTLKPDQIPILEEFIKVQINKSLGRISNNVSIKQIKI